MDLDDSFAEGFLHHVKARKNFVNEKKTEILSSGKKRAALTEDAEGNTNVPPEESPKRQCTGVLQSAYSVQNKENIEMMDDTTSDFVPYHSGSKTRGLAALKKKYSNDEDNDVGYSKDTEQEVNKCNRFIFATNSSALCAQPKQKSRLADLAANIRQWEDDVHTPTLSSKNVTSETPTNSAKTNAYQISNEKTQQNVNLVPTSYVDNPSDNESINEDDFAENYEDIKSDNGVSNIEMDFSPSEEVKKWEEIPNKMFVAAKEVTLKVPQEPAKSNVDPAELPLSARKALFENAFINGTPKLNDDVFDHKMSVAQRAAMFENATKAQFGAKATTFKEPKRMAFSNFEKFEKGITNIHKSPVKSIQTTTKNNLQEIKASPVKNAFQTASPVKNAFQTASPVKNALQTAPLVKNVLETASPVKKILNPVSPMLSPTKNVGSHTRLIQQKLMESTGSNWQEKQTAKAAEERKQEISSLVNHWEKLSSSSSVDNNSELEKAPLASEENSSYKSDIIYEATESEEESEQIGSDNEGVNDDDESKDEYIEKECEFTDNDKEDDVDSIAERAENKAFYYEETETESLISEKETSEENFCDISNQTSDNNTRSFTSSCYSGVSSVASDSNYHASNSQSCSSGSSVGSFDFCVPKTEEVFIAKSEKKENKNPEINLIRTVSAYRREKQETKLTPVRTVVRREKVSSPESLPDTDFTEVIQQRLKELQDEILRQQIVISQTSQALNLCSATAEFSGSTEQVEGERLLLIATQKRQACLNEIQRLKTCGAQGENLIDGTGSLTITDLQLPLKREFIASQLEGRGTDTVHYFLCLIRHGAQVIVTQMMSTDERSKDGALNFTNHIQLRNLPADFSIVFEVYALQTKKEVLPHEKKYHIKRENSKKRLTPKGKKIDAKMPAVCSPGGPNAVRSPSFGVVGFTRFNLSNCNKKTFTLDKVPFTSPLEGVLRVHIQLHAEHKVMHKGFLTFYEDVGEIGALYRRWCVLDGSHISYWLYPEDEHKERPVGLIDLRQCVTGTVKSVSALECARSHTFKLVTVRPQKKGDKDTLISRTVNTLTTTKYLLTADTKDERILWCNKINEALETIRKWDPQALRPIESINI